MAGPFGNFGVGIDLPAPLLEDHFSGRGPGSDLLKLVGGGLQQFGDGMEKDRHRREEMAWDRQKHQDQLGLQRERLGQQERLTAARIKAAEDRRAAAEKARGARDEYVLIDPDTGEELTDGPGAPGAALEECVGKT